MKRILTILAGTGVVLLTSTRDGGAQTVNDVLSFLLTNRSISTDDFVRDSQAAAATRDTMARVLQLELGAVPVASSTSGFTYRFNPSLGTVERTSDSFGPFFVNRSLTLGARQLAVSLSYQDTSFDALDGRSLRDGALLSTASRLTGETQPFDVETVTLHLRTRTAAVSASLGVTDRLDVGITMPFVSLSMDGERVDDYRGQRSVQATASARASGIGDVLLRSKYNAWRRGGSGLAFGADLRLSSGSVEDLLGAGATTFTPRAAVSVERGRTGVHATFGMRLGEQQRLVEYGAALTIVGSSRLTVVGELSGRRVGALGHLVEVAEPHPSLTGVETVRLVSTDEAAHQATVTAGVKWNAVSTWIVSWHVSRSMTTSGLTSGWVPTVSLDYLVMGQ